MATRKRPPDSPQRTGVISSGLSCSCEVSRQTASKTLKRLDKGGLLVWKGKNKADPFQYYELPDGRKEL